MMSCVEPVQFQFTPDEIHELLTFLQDDVDSPVNCTSSGSEMNPPAVNSTSSGSEVNRSVYSQEERKRRRMESNRESARRSRQRKKRHVEKLNDQVNHLKEENRELKNQLCLLGQQCYYAFSEMNRLRSEYMDLQMTLTGLSQILAANAMHAVPFTPTNLN